MEAALASLDADEVPRRIRARDHTLWHPDPAGISDRLGWLDACDWMRPRLGEVRAFGESLVRDGVKDVVLLGMGGSSLAAEVFRETFGSATARPALHVLDTTSPSVIRRVSAAIHREHFHALVASKSGSTAEVTALLAHFRELAGGDGGRFTAITDPGTSLEERARREGFRACFCNDPDVGGRYSALTYFGQVPAAVLGVDVEALLDRAAEMAAACLAEGSAAENPGCALGAALGEAAHAGRDKLTLLLSEEIASFGLWVEQLVAESTGKDGAGIVPVIDEPAAGAEPGADRLYVSVRLDGGENRALDRRVEALESRGAPVVRLRVPDTLSVGAEMYRWMHATAVAGHLLGIHPFDQPDVQSTKEATGRILQALGSGAPWPDTPSGNPAELLAAAGPGSYVALLVFGDPGAELRAALQELRAAIEEHLGLASTLGIGPRFLHSTGQLHKGGPAGGIFLQIVLEEGPLPVPGLPYGFDALLRAQAAGDLAALRDAGRRVARIEGADPAEAVRGLTERLG